jgi:hypothetical protein
MAVPWATVSDLLCAASCWTAERPIAAEQPLSRVGLGATTGLGVITPCSLVSQRAATNHALHCFHIVLFAVHTPLATPGYFCMQCRPLTSSSLRS